MNDNPYAHRAWFSTRQRMVCLTFATAEQAQAWDDAGRPLNVLDQVDVVPS